MRSPHVALALLIPLTLGCRDPNSPDSEDPILLYGVGDEPRTPPAGCKELGRIEASSQGTDSIPEKALRREARDLGGNAVARIRKNGKEEGFLGFVYHYKAQALLCPRKPSAPAGSAAPSASESAPAGSPSAATAP